MVRLPLPKGSEMRIAPRSLLVSATLLFVAGLTLQACTAPAPPAESDAEAEADTQVSPTFNNDFSIREVMTYIIDPVSDYVFDAIIVDITAEGVAETVPTTDEDWATVMRGAVSLIEGGNLLKISRRVAPADDNVSKNPNELHPDEIQALIDRSPGVWNAYVDAMQAEAFTLVDIVNARATDRLIEAGSDIDRVCEACHLQFWYPSERDAIIRNRNSTVTPPAPGN